MVKNQLVAALVDPHVALLTLLVAGVATVLLFLLIFQWITRFGVLLILAVAGPLARISTQEVRRNADVWQVTATGQRPGMIFRSPGVTSPRTWVDRAAKLHLYDSLSNRDEHPSRRPVHPDMTEIQPGKARIIALA